MADLKDQYLTVSDFAEIAGVTKQAIYKRIDTKEWQPYVKRLGNITVIHKDAIEKYYNPETQTTTPRISMATLKGKVEELEVTCNQKEAEVVALRHKVELLELELEQTKQQLLAYKERDSSTTNQLQSQLATIQEQQLTINNLIHTQQQLLLEDKQSKHKGIFSFIGRSRTNEREDNNE